MNYITYKDNILFCEDIPLSELAEEYGTPLYVYSKNQIIEKYRFLNGAFGNISHLVCYALKANANHHILQVLAAEGAGADVVSAGELHLALKAGFSPDKIVFAGVGKREDEIEFALNQNIFSFNVESVSELHTISRAALRTGKKARIKQRNNTDN
jgi:diaminopimelate decarboxylase